MNQRNSRHGVDFAYNLHDVDLNAYYQRYCETLLAVDESLGRLLKYLEANEELENTIVIYMGDNGFQFGEHGLIDKRTVTPCHCCRIAAGHFPCVIRIGPGPRNSRTRSIQGSDERVHALTCYQSFKLMAMTKCF